MPVIQSFWQRLYVAIVTLSWWVLAACFAVHALTSYVALALVGERDLTTTPVTFAYFYMTTATTVGYGDLSPGTGAGRVVGSLVVLPGSIALFTAFLGKAIAGMSIFWRRRLQGLGNYSERTGHTLVIGWQGTRTRRLLEGLAHDHRGDRTILLAGGLSENPTPELADFIATQGMADLDSFVRAGAAGATTVVVRGADDDETLAATLAATSAAPQAHIVAHFSDASAAQLIRRRFPDVEVVTSIAAELLVRAARDPGASQLAALMFSGHTADTAFSLKLPVGCESLRYIDALSGLKRDYELTLIGLGDGNGLVDLNCAAGKLLRPGDTLYYIADQRCTADAIDWAALVLGAQNRAAA